jgi:Protein of unknown function (DUF1559)
VVAGRQPVLRQPDRLLDHPRRTSNTAAFSEWIKGKAGANSPGLNLVYQIAQLSFGGPRQDIAACQAASTPLWDFKGEYWTLQDAGRGGPYYHIMPPNQPSCNTSADYGVIDSFIAASSFHPSGVNVLLMNGSVRFIKESINLSIWNALGTRSGGEVISADAF